jgi:hypothetical protein
MSAATATGATDTNFTFSTWLKRSEITPTVQQKIYESSTDVNNLFAVYITTADLIGVFDRQGSVVQYSGLTDPAFKDPCSWYHLCVEIDTTQSAGSRVKIWVNGVQQTLTVSQDYGASGGVYADYYNRTLGRRVFDATQFGNVYLADTIFVDSLTYTATDFGRFKNGIWVPIDPVVTLAGTSFKLEYGDSANLGTDTSGLGNDFTENNFTASDQVEDTPTNNWCTMNPISVQSVASPTFSDGSLTTTAAADSTTRQSSSTMKVPTSGKWYCELTMTEKGTSVGNNTWFGLRNPIGGTSAAYGADDGNFYSGGWSAYGDSWTDGDVIGMAVNADDNEITFYKNNVSQGTESITATQVNQTVYLSQYTQATIGVANLNFGQLAFTYTPPAGYKALCSKNLPNVGKRYLEGNKGLHVETYEGDGTTPKSLAGVAFSPDLVWIKNRDNNTDHNITDSVRGNNKQLYTNILLAETTFTSIVKSLDVAGFTIGNNARVNTLNESYVAWCWKKDPAYGLDIVTYSGDDDANPQSVPHNLGVTPEMIVVKCRSDGSTNWITYHNGVNGGTDPEDYAVFLNLTDAQQDSATRWNDTAPTSSIFTAGTSISEAGRTFVAYLFASIPGFSKVFSYLGNADADGPFIHCGFRPRFLLMKNTSSAVTQWVLFDTARNIGNTVYRQLKPNVNDAEYTGNNNEVDILSNGFKCRTANTATNESGSNIVGIAFAETPFKYANAR